MQKQISYILFICTFFITSFISQSVVAQAPVLQWEKCYGGYQGDFGNGITLGQDSGYISIGNVSSNNGDVSGLHNTPGIGNDIGIVRLNNYGKIIWQKALGGSKDDKGYAIVRSRTGGKGYVFVGSTYSNDGDVSVGNANGNAWIVKIDDTGKILWQKSDNAVLYSIEQTRDGGYILGGEDGDAVIEKIDSLGNQQWKKRIGGPDVDAANSVKPTFDGGYLVTGSTSSYFLSSNNYMPAPHGSLYYVIKLDSVGNVVWYKTYGGSTSEKGYYGIQTSDSSYVIVGLSSSNDYDVVGAHLRWDAWVLKLNDTGKIIWSKNLGGADYDFATSVIEDYKGNYVIAGTTSSNDGDLIGNVKYGQWIISLSPGGVLNWQTVIGCSMVNNPNKYSARAYGIVATADSGYVTTGYVQSGNADAKDYHQYVYTPPYGPLEGDYFIVKLHAKPTISQACQGGTVSIPYDTTGIPMINDTLTAQLSDSSGSFASPVNIGTSVSPAAGSMSGTIPAGTVPGLHYQIRIITSTGIILPATQVPVYPFTVPVIPHNVQLCKGSLYNLVVIDTQKNLIYEWKGPNAFTSSYGILLHYVTAANAGLYNLMVVAPNGCQYRDSTRIDVIDINADATVAINVAPNDTICLGDTARFTASVTNVINPVYQWLKNGVAVTGATADSFKTSAIANGDVIALNVKSTAVCNAVNITSNNVTMHIHIVSPVSVSISVAPKDTVCPGDTAKFTSVITNGLNPVYQWLKNGVAVAGATADSFKTKSMVGGEVITLNVQSAGICNTRDTIASNAITIHTYPVLPLLATINVTPNDTICVGDTASFNSVLSNATNPSYQWLKNGLNIPGDTAGTFSTSSLVNGDVITLAVKSYGLCGIGTATSSPIIMHVYPHIVYGAPIVTANPAVFTPGIADTFTAVVSGFSAAGFTFQWRMNNANIPGATAQTLITDATYHAGDKISVVVKSKMPCAQPDSAVSDPISLGVAAPAIYSGNLSLFPNPNKGSFTVSGASSNGPVAIEVINIMGQTVYHHETAVQNNRLNNTINVINAVPGIYLLKVTSGNISNTIRFSIN